MPRRSMFVALFLAGPVPVVASGCACDRPLFPRLRCLFDCHPAQTYTPAQSYAPTPAYAPPMAGPAYAAPVAQPIAYAPAQPPCVGCGSSPVSHFGGAPLPPSAPVGYPTTNELPPGAIPVGPPVSGPMTGPQMSEPQAQYPSKAMPGYATAGAPTLLPAPVAAPLR